MENQLNLDKFPFSLNQKVMDCPENAPNSDLSSYKEIIENLRSENLSLKEENNLLRNQVNQYKNAVDLNTISLGSLALTNDEPAEEVKNLNEKINNIQLIDENSGKDSRKLYKAQALNTELNIDEILKQKEDLERRFTEEIDRYKEEVWILKWHLQNNQITSFSGKSLGLNGLGPESSEG